MLEFEEIKQQVYFERTEGAKSYLDLFKGGNPRRVLLGCSLQMWSQLSGMNVMMYECNGTSLNSNFTVSLCQVLYRLCIPRRRFDGSPKQSNRRCEWLCCSPISCQCYLWFRPSNMSLTSLLRVGLTKSGVHLALNSIIHSTCDYLHRQMGPPAYAPDWNCNDGFLVVPRRWSPRAVRSLGQY